MRLGIAIEDTWDFFNEIYADLAGRYTTQLFKRRALKSGPMHVRINRMLLERDMGAFLASNDVAFFEWASGLLVTASHLPKRCGIVTRLHRFELYDFADRINWEVVDRVILVSQAKQREFAARFPAHAAKTVVASPSTSLEKFTFAPKPFTGEIGILCHMTPRKRVYDLILTFYDLLQQEPNLRLHVAGGRHVAFADYYEAMQFVVRKLGIQEKVIFYGNVKETWDWYHKIDLFISNSYSEGLQVAPMEAMASGCPCFSHHWDGAEELVPADRLFVTEGELQRKVLAYCALPEVAKQEQRAAARAWACEKFDIRQTIVDIRGVVEDVAAARVGA